MADKSYINIFLKIDPDEKPGRKTSVFTVASKAGHMLGEIKWHSPWRRYAFFLMCGTIFEEQCLREIADFVEARTQQHKEK